MMRYQQKLKERSRAKFATLIVSSFGFLSALSWFEVIKLTVYAFPNEKIFLSFILAVITSITAFLAVFLTKKLWR